MALDLVALWNDTTDSLDEMCTICSTRDQDFRRNSASGINDPIRNRRGVILSPLVSASDPTTRRAPLLCSLPQAPLFSLSLSHSLTFCHSLSLSVCFDASMRCARNIVASLCLVGFRGHLQARRVT